MKVGIYSGTFDPIHNGHVAFALEAIERFGLDKVFFLPEPRPRRKQGIKAFEHRVNMIKLAIADQPKIGLIILEQPRFTVHETMPIINARFDNTELCMLMGDDMLDHFLDWPQVSELIDSIRFILGIRKYDEEHIDEFAKTLKQSLGREFKFKTFRPTDYRISSSKIKQNIKRGHGPIGLNDAVAAYIKDNGLYSAGEK